MSMTGALRRRLAEFPRIERTLRAIRARWRRFNGSLAPLAGPPELQAVKRVLWSGRWNMTAGTGLVHEDLEQAFARFVGSSHAVAVNTGGMAIQMTLRALGVQPGDEVIHQVDTCVANAFAVLNAGATPIFADVSDTTFMMAEGSLRDRLSPRTRVVMPVHMWGNPDDLAPFLATARAKGLAVVEDGCLALGATRDGRHVGTSGIAGVFSFGALKPIQAGEGGMIVTDDAALARELRTIRSYGDTTVETGVRDQRTLSWNGRLSEIVAAVALEQLRRYPGQLDELSGRVAELKDVLRTYPGLTVVDEIGAGGRSAYSQVVLRVDEAALGISKQELLARWREQGLNAWHANFEPITTLTFFRGGEWRKWVRSDDDLARIERNYTARYPAAERVFQHTGLGIPKASLLGRGAGTRLAALFARTLGGTSRRSPATTA